MRRPCCNGRNLGDWTMQEDKKLIDYNINFHGEDSWSSIPKATLGLGSRGRSYRQRWTNYLRPKMKVGNFAQDEEDLIIKLHALLGNRWSLIAGRLPGRTDNEVKKYWNYHLKKKLIHMGIDPNNHKLIHHLPQLQTNSSKFKAFSFVRSFDQSKKNIACCSKKPLKSHESNANNIINDLNDDNKITCEIEETSPILDLNLKLTI